ERVSEAEELRRLVPVLKRLKGMLSIPISVDTYKSAVAEKALEHGAATINDVIGTIRQDLDASADRAVRAGVDRARIAIDPGLGFGKRKEQNSEILARLAAFAALEFPLVVGPSRKSFLPKSEDASPGFSQCATAAAVTAAVLGGAHIVRVHDVGEMKAAALVADQIFNFAGTSDSSGSRAAPPRSGGSGFRR